MLQMGWQNKLSNQTNQLITLLDSWKLFLKIKLYSDTQMLITTLSQSTKQRKANIKNFQDFSFKWTSLLERFNANSAPLALEFVSETIFSDKAFSFTKES